MIVRTTTTRKGGGGVCVSGVDRCLSPSPYVAIKRSSPYVVREISPIHLKGKAYTAQWVNIHRCLLHSEILVVYAMGENSLMISSFKVLVNFHPERAAPKTFDFVAIFRNYYFTNIWVSCQHEEKRNIDAAQKEGVMTLG